MKMHPNEVVFYYDPKMSIAKKALAHLTSTGKKVRSVEYHKEKLTPTIWRDILDSLKMNPKSLVDKSSDYYQNNLRGKNFDDDDWINILTHHPDLIRAPIVINGNRALLLDNPTDVYRL